MTSRRIVLTQMKTLVQSILACFKQTRRDDPIFGRMLYMGDRLRYWEGIAKFAPTGVNVDVFVDGSSDDDMKQQRELFKNICEEWSSLRDPIGEMLQESCRERGRELLADSVWDQFQVSSLSVPKSGLDSAEWEISFSARSEDHLLSVNMKGRRPLRVAIDG